MGTSLRDVYTKIQKLSETPSTNDKIALLKIYLEDKIFRKVCWCTYTSTIKFNVKIFPPFEKISGFSDKGWEVIIKILEKLANQQGADNSIKSSLFLASSIDKETYAVVAMICDGDLRCGIGARTINKAMPNTIRIWSYKRCATSKHIDNLTFEPYASAQCKADGAFANMFIKDDLSISFFARSGKPIKCLQHLKSKIKDNTPLIQYGRRRGIDHQLPNEHIEGKVYQGELRVFNPNGTIMSRKQGNGIINECIHGTVSPEVAKSVFFTVWNVVTIAEFFNGESESTYRDSFYQVNLLVHRVGSDKHIRIVKFENVSSLEEAYAFYRKMRYEGEEGAIIKNINAKWEDNQSGSFDDIKIKHSFECDLKVVGWNYGTKGKKYGETVGSVDFESECGKLKVNVSGLLDSEREWDWDMMVGSICTVEAESVISSKSKSTYSLYTPSFIEPREDKTEANTLEEIIEIAEESKKTRRRKA
jgi:DNA ligase 1